MYVVLRPQKDLDATGANVLKQELLNFLDSANAQQQTYWVIDFTQVNSIDHFGLFALVELRRLARQHQCHLRLCNLTKQVRLMFEITELDRRLKIWDKKISETSLFQHPLVLC